MVRCHKQFASCLGPSLAINTMLILDDELLCSDVLYSLLYLWGVSV
jgi:hypothetical protein